MPLFLKVTHKITKEVMVLKELFRFDKEAHLSFTKEVLSLASHLMTFS